MKISSLRLAIANELRAGPRTKADLVIAVRPLVPPEKALWAIRHRAAITRQQYRRRMEALGDAAPPRRLGPHNHQPPSLEARIDSGIRLMVSECLYAMRNQGQIHFNPGRGQVVTWIGGPHAIKVPVRAHVRNGVAVRASVRVRKILLTATR